LYDIRFRFLWPTVLLVGVGLLNEGVRKGLKVGVPKPAPLAVRGEGSPFFPLFEGRRLSMTRRAELVVIRRGRYKQDVEVVSADNRRAAR
jgi:hypothetical protein